MESSTHPLVARSFANGDHPERALSASAQRAFRRRLLHWFDVNRRDLPWRKARNPYRVWVSEVMLQQTRVAAVLEHYRRFLRRFPTVSSLAQARESEVLAAWSGLGYYRRAHNLQAAARLIAGQGGRFPRTAAQWRQLPGVGRYTAAAIASIAYGEPCAVVDGNVQRVLARLFATAELQAWDVADQLLSPSRPGDFNQALMELGATVCLPRSPLCAQCPVSQWCGWRGADPSRPAEVRNKRRAAYSLELSKGRVLLRQRPLRASLMPGMWELPQHTANGKSAPAMFEVRHSITNTDYRVAVFPGAGRGRWVRVSQLGARPLTGLARKILRTAGII